MIYYVTSLPPDGEPNSLYILQGPGNTAQLYAASATRQLYDVSTDSVINTLAQARVDIAIDNLIGAAPGTLDTIQELAAALNDNPDVIANLTSSIAAKANTADVYTKTQADATTTSLQTAINGKQNTLSNAVAVAKLGDGTFDGKPLVVISEAQW